jgi:hypothetical protein
MPDLLEAVLEAHGGLERWSLYTRVEANIVTGGALWGIKGQPQDASPRRMTVDLQREWSSVQPFGAEDQKTDFTPERVAIEKLDGRVVAERLNPRDSFAGHQLATPWDPLHRAYFNGYALWTYLTTPFLLTMPGVTARAIDPVEQDGEKLTGLQAHFPPELATHSAVQEFFFGEDHLLRRHDYRVDVAGKFRAIQYVSNSVEVDGIMVPATRRAFRCDAQGRPEQLMVSIDISDIRFISAC